jgi:TolB protein
VTRLGAQTPLQLTQPTANDGYPAWSPDGKWLAYQSNHGGRNQIWLMPLAGGESHALTAEPESSTMHSGVRVMTPTWSPDSKTVLYVSTRTGNYNIYSIPVDGGEARSLSNAPGSQRFPSYSMDGQKIVFPSSRLAHDLRFSRTSIQGFGINVLFNRSWSAATSLMLPR